MNRLRLIAGRLGHPFCRTSGRGCQQDIHVALFKIADDRVDRRCFSGTRTARDYQKSAVDRLNHRADLQLIQLDLFLFLDNCQTFPNLFFRFGTADVQVVQHAGGV